MFSDKVVASVSKSGIVPVDCNQMWLRNPSPDSDNGLNRFAFGAGGWGFIAKVDHA